MKTVRELRTKSNRIDDDAHWLWTGALFRRQPRVHAPDYTRDPTGKTMTIQSGARAAWHILNKKPIPDGKRAVIGCGHYLCVNPHCVQLMTMAEQTEFVMNTGILKARTDLQRAANDARRRMTPEQHRQVMLAETNLALMARQTGFSEDTLSMTRRGLRNSRLSMGIFAGLVKQQAQP
jgi:hypothetical protein